MVTFREENDFDIKKNIINLSDETKNTNFQGLLLIAFSTCLFGISNFQVKLVKN
jgi:hypothetical protein